MALLTSFVQSCYTTQLNLAFVLQDQFNGKGRFFEIQTTTLRQKKHKKLWPCLEIILRDHTPAKIVAKITSRDAKMPQITHQNLDQSIHRKKP